MPDLVETLIQDAISKGRRAPGDFRGCSEKEIAGLESRMGIELPKMFRIYLRHMGKSAGEMLQGSDIRFGCLHELTGEAYDEARERNFQLPDDIFAFYAHQGYDYMYFRLAHGDDDPKVYRFHMAWDAPRQVLPAFSDYLRWMFGTAMEIPPDDMPSA